VTACRLRVVAAALLLLWASIVPAQPPGRRLTTIGAIRQFPGYFHLENVLLRGELVENGRRVMLRADERELRVFLKDVSTRSGPVEVRGQVIDVGRLTPDDPRAIGFAEGRETDQWPRPGEELILNVTAISEAATAATASVRALSLEPWKWEGQAVTVTGNFRGRNLFGDLPDAPGASRYDFVLRGAEGAVWVTGIRPRGKGFDLDVDRRLDAGKWLHVTGTVSRTRGLVTLAATQIVLGTEPADAAPAEDAAAPPPPARPAEVVFSSPTPDETDVSATTTIRIQFSRGLQEASIPGNVRVSYVGGAASDAGAEFKATYDAANRALLLRFVQPLERFRTIKVETLDGLKAFDGAPVTPWTLTFTVGG
jgi:hypothetical protein